MLSQLTHAVLPFGFAEFGFALRLLVAAALGVCMGLERSLAGKHAGMRTYALVSLGSCMFVIVGTLASYEMAVFSGINPLQIASSVVIGIGFIGSGLAIFRGDHPGELTTATGIWVVAGIGMACGFGLYVTAVVATVLGLVILYLLTNTEQRLRVRYGYDQK